MCDKSCVDGNASIPIDNPSQEKTYANGSATSSTSIGRNAAEQNTMHNNVFRKNGPMLTKNVALKSSVCPWITYPAGLPNWKKHTPYTGSLNSRQKSKCAVS